MAELESRCEALEESQRHSLTEQLNRLSAENLQLRDRTDELSAEVELLRGQLATARYQFSLFCLLLLFFLFVRMQLIFLCFTYLLKVLVKLFQIYKFICFFSSFFI